MTIQTNYFKNNWISFSTLVVLIGFVIHQAKWQEQVDNHIKNFDIHKVDETLHMPFQQKIKVFVPRVELEGRLKGIELLLKEIRTDIKNINR